MGFFGILDKNAQNELLNIARNSISKYLKTKKNTTVKTENEILKNKAGAFVTLKIGGQLRGCIGNFADDKPIYEMVHEMALAAAFEDPRFQEFEQDELDSVHIEISILSGLKPIKPEDVEVGVHGLYITKGFYRGVFLPQVPVEWNWEREEYLDQLCLKAGLPVGEWKNPKVKLESFTAQVFEEEA
jgi:uncharacterized protein